MGTINPSSEKAPDAETSGASFEPAAERFVKLMLPHHADVEDYYCRPPHGIIAIGETYETHLIPTL